MDKTLILTFFCHIAQPSGVGLKMVPCLPLILVAPLIYWKAEIINLLTALNRSIVRLNRKNSEILSFQVLQNLKFSKICKYSGNP